VANVQGMFHHADFDYLSGSPHLKHGALTTEIASSLDRLVRSVRAVAGTCDALELGAGHGPFTEPLHDAGASVVVTEMSDASAAFLRARFGNRSGVRVEHDEHGDWIFRTRDRFDLVVCISVLHHIPDYLGSVGRLVELIRPGGALVSWQDPIWYPSLPHVVRAASASAYFIWRIGQGDLRRGLSTRLRRIRGVLDESRPEDAAEYHVVREGVDQLALMRLMEPHFSSVQLRTYWSTQWGPLHRLGRRLGLENTFGIVATGRVAAPERCRSPRAETNGAV
jgi:SAM-dependent methyltransferase